MEIQKRSEFVKHLNRLAMILELVIVYSVGFDDVDKSGIPNASYNKELECVTIAWLPDFCGYSNDTLGQYVEMAKQKFGDYENGQIKKIIDEAENFFLTL